MTKEELEKLLDEKFGFTESLCKQCEHDWGDHYRGACHRRGCRCSLDNPPCITRIIPASDELKDFIFKKLLPEVFKSVLKDDRSMPTMSVESVNSYLLGKRDFANIIKQNIKDLGVEI